MSEAVREGRVEHRVPPADDLKDPIRVERETGRGVHPAVRREDPEGADDGADRHGETSEEMHGGRDPVHAEQHDADEPGLEKKREQHLVREKRPDHIGCAVRELAPVRADLVRHHESGDDAHRKAEREQVNPEAQQVVVDAPAGLQPKRADDRDKARMPIV